MSKFQNVKKESTVAEQIKNFTVQAAAILTAAGPGLLIIVIIVAAVAAAYIEYVFHAKVVGEFAMVSGGGYGMFRFAVGSAGVQVAKQNKWIPAFLFVAISLGFTLWSSYHVGPAADLLRIGGTPEAAKIIILTVLWMAFAGELCLGIYSYIMDHSDDEEQAEPAEIPTGPAKEWIVGDGIEGGAPVKKEPAKRGKGGPRK